MTNAEIALDLFRQLPDEQQTAYLERLEKLAAHNEQKELLLECFSVG